MSDKSVNIPKIGNANTILVTVISKKPFYLFEAINLDCFTMNLYNSFFIVDNSFNNQMKTYFMLDIIDKAMRTAAIAHDKQYRKNDGETPYIYHPTMSGFYLMKHGFDDSLVAASILHDTVEDTDLSLSDIERDFGPKIKEMVDYCTEDKSLSWEERKQGQIDGIKHYPEEILFLKLADKLHNLRDTYNDYQKEGEKIFANFKRGMDKQKWYYHELLNSFASRDEVNTHPMFKQFESIVNELYT